VDLDQVEAVPAQSLAARLDPLADVLLVSEFHLRGEEGFVVARESLAENLLAGPLAVARRGVEVGDPLLTGALDGPDHLPTGRGVAGVVLVEVIGQPRGGAAEAEPAHSLAGRPEFGVLHSGPAAAGHK